MAKLQRKNQKVFASDALPEELGIFGSFANGLPAYSDDPAVQQSLDDKWRGGWPTAVAGNNSPCIEDMNTLFFICFYQIAYLMQQGIAEWGSATEYNDGSLTTSTFGLIYKSKTNANINNPVSDLTNWVPVSAIGGHKVVWNTDGPYDSSTLPSEEIYPNVGPVFRFGALDKATNTLTYNWTVPLNYIPQSSLNLRFSYFTEEVTNSLRWQVNTKIVKAGVDAVDAPSETALITGSLRAISATSKMLQTEILNFRTGLESYILSPGDIVRFELSQSTTGNTSVEDVLMIANNTEIVL